MKTPFSILVPVDFSQNAVTAYKFACNLAKHLSASIKLLYVETDIMSSTNMVDMLRYPKTKAGLEKRMKAFASKEKPDNIKLSISTEVVEAVNLTKEIVKQSNLYDLSIVGAKGENLTSKKLFGSIPTLLAQKSSSPVIVVPADAEFYPPAKILFASNWESTDKKIVQNFVQWAQLFGAQANFLHITQDYSAHEFDQVKEAIFDTLEEYEVLDFSYLIIDKKANSPLAGIMEYANEEEIDWIAVTNRQRGFLNNILGLSLTKEITTNPRNPILITHFPQQSGNPKDRKNTNDKYHLQD